MPPSTIKKGPLSSWLLRGCLAVGFALFASCSSDEGQPTPPDSGGPGTCLAPTQACPGGCADLSSDPTNCGSCGVACVIGQTCQAGSCALSCTAPEVDCGGLCADPSSNALHCGGCDQPCGNGELCENSACVTGSCPAGQTLCNGACVDTASDALNCGDCNVACLVGQSCSASACSAVSCPTGQLLCSGACTDVTTPSNCGGCGQVCDTGQTCEAGVCSDGNTNGGLGGSTSTSADSTSSSSSTGAGGSTTTGDTTDSTTTMGGSTTTSDSTTSTTGQQPTGECRVWMAPSGNDSNDGSEASPVASLLAAYDLMCPKPPDGTANGAECLGEAPRTICAKPGTYQETERLEFKKTRMGTASNRLTLMGDPNSSERPLFDFSGQPRLSCGANPDNIGGFTVNAHYVTIKNIAVRAANDNCILVQGAEGIVENVLTYECADTGIQISSGGEYQGSGTNNSIINCDSHTNNDSQCDGENADGFAIKEGTGTGNEFIGCRAWNNADDGYDLYAWTSPVVIRNSWAFNQCATTEGGGSDCNGFKLGGDDVSAAHELQDLIAVGNRGDAGGVGFTANSNPASMTCSGTCAAWDNDTASEEIGGIATSPVGDANVTNMAADGARNTDRSLKAISDL